MDKEQQCLLNFISPEKLKEAEQKIESMQAETPLSEESDNNVKPIPQEFPPKYDVNKTQEVVKNITKILSCPNYSFNRFLDISLAAVEGREKDYMELINDMDKNELSDYVKCFSELYSFFIDGYYDDVLGTYYQQNHKSSNGYFITPFNISLMMAEMLGITPEDTLCEPCCGSGSMLLAAKFVIHKNYGWKASCYYLPKMYGMDICDTYVKMCKLQLYLSNYLYIIGRTYDAVMDIKQRGNENDRAVSDHSFLK
jgi:type I restriction-modification system DNA methylase subunit